MKNNTAKKDERTPSWGLSLVPFVVLIAALFFVIRFFGADALDGASQVALLFGATVCVAIAMIVCHVPWKKLEEAMTGNISSIGTAILILFLIGAISGTWMISGIVPTLIYYGMKVLSPAIFLFACCIICAAISLVTGSSWTTIATVGVALIGVGMALGYSAGWTAGAIISGAYFGDKISPLSDTTVLASSSTGTPLFEHIRYMLITTVPSFTITCIIFLIVSICHASGSEAASSAADFAPALKETFCISPWLMIVPVITGVMIAKKLPALVTLTVSAIAAAVAAVIAQPEIVAQIGGGSGETLGDMFKGVMIMFYGDTSISTGNLMLDGLVETHGMTGMLNTVFLIMSAAAFGGAMTGSGMIRSITEALTRKINGRTSLVAGTVSSGIACNMITGDQYLSIILVSSLYKKLFKDKGFESRLLSRSAEDSATVTSVLIPWNSCGMTQSTVLKVPTLDYLPYCFFNLISPLMSITIAAIGYKIVRHDPQE